MADNKWIHIENWMGKKLGLRANDLICFALIYSFSRDGESQFKGTLNYLAQCMFATEPTALSTLKKLLGVHLINKEDVVINGKNRCFYSTNIIYDEGEIFVIDSTKEPLVMTTKEPLVVTTKESLVNNNSTINSPLIKEDNKKENKKLSNDNKKSDFPFEIFWSKYRKGSKSAALVKWDKLKENEKERAFNTIDDYITYCRRSNRPLKDCSAYLNQKCFNDDWTIVPDYYTIHENDDQRRKKFKEWMCNDYPDLIYHRNPLTFEQAQELFEMHSVSTVKAAMNRLCYIDIHQYFNIKSGIEKVLESDEIDEES